jgi:hypothetical protein
MISLGADSIGQNVIFHQRATTPDPVLSVAAEAHTEELLSQATMIEAPAPTISAAPAKQTSVLLTPAKLLSVDSASGVKLFSSVKKAKTPAFPREKEIKDHLPAVAADLDTKILANPFASVRFYLSVLFLVL